MEHRAGSSVQLQPELHDKCNPFPKVTEKLKAILAQAGGWEPTTAEHDRHLALQAAKSGAGGSSLTEASGAAAP